jgi:uncharacterized protein (TIGR01244 family)
MTRFIPLDDDTIVAGQIRPEDMAAIAAAGVTLIVNNRPDHEEPGQPTTADLRAAAEAAGLTYRDIPVAGGIAPRQIAAACEALDEGEGKTLFFCRSATRSTYLWALARASRGADPSELVRWAAAAGYDLAPIIIPSRPG